MSYVYMVSVRVSVDNDDRLDWTSPPTARSRLRRTEDRACVQGTYQTLCSVCLSVCSYCAKFTRPGFLELLQLYFSFTEGPALQSLVDFDMVGHTLPRAFAGVRASGLSLRKTFFVGYENSRIASGRRSYDISSPVPLRSR